MLNVYFKERIKGKLQFIIHKLLLSIQLLIKKCGWQLFPATVLINTSTLFLANVNLQVNIIKSMLICCD